MDEKTIISEYLPEGALEAAYKWVVDYNVHLKISKQRKTKLGDYRPPINHSNHRISINHNLNKYSFLITFVHEFAHLVVWEKHRNRVDPHGIEWKNEYRNMMMPFLNENIFPEDIEKVLEQSIVNSKASSSSDLKLSRVLSKYDDESDRITLEELEDNSIFFIEGGRRFKKGAKQRTRYKCQNLDNNKFYLVHALTPVIKFEAL
jgi:SprT protein